jgi:hypothetical protein
VEHVTWSLGVPTMESGPHTGYIRRVNAAGVSGGRQLAIGLSVGREFFDVYRIPLITGRALGPDDDDRRVVIDERIAATFFLDASPVGQSLAWGDERLEIVGVVRTVQRQRPQYPPTIYWKYKPGELPYATFTIRCTADCPSEAVIRHALLPIESLLRAGAVDRLSDRFDRELVAPRMSASMAIVFASVALATAAGGLFSVLSYVVGRRRRDRRLLARHRPTCLLRRVDHRRARRRPWFGRSVVAGQHAHRASVRCHDRRSHELDGGRCYSGVDDDRGSMAPHAHGHAGRSGSSAPRGMRRGAP